MKTEEELRKFLKKCDKVRGFGMSEGSCPFEKGRKRGCCAECSTPSTIQWVLENKGKPTDNAQNELINIFK
jgi:hypothetical protein